MTDQHIIEIMARVLNIHSEHQWYIAQIERALAALRAAGYAVVPREPTDEMRIAAVDKLGCYMHDLWERHKDKLSIQIAVVDSKQTDTVWRAMIEAAEQPPTGALK